MTAADLDRLRKLAGLLGSDHDGEVVNAARMASALLKRNRLSWAQIINLESATPRRQPPADDDAQLDLGVIPETTFATDLLRRYIEAFLQERRVGRYDFDPSFLKSVAGQHHWTHRQRRAVIKTLRKVWMIRHEAGLE